MGSLPLRTGTPRPPQATELLPGEQLYPKERSLGGLVAADWLCRITGAGPPDPPWDALHFSAMCSATSSGLASRLAPWRGAPRTWAESRVSAPTEASGAIAANERSRHRAAREAGARLTARALRGLPLPRLRQRSRGEMMELEADHRRHAEIENAIRDLKYGVGLNHLPSGRFAANGAWLAVQVIAHNLARWTARLGLGEGIVTTRTLRRGEALALGWPVGSRALATTGATAPGLTPAHSAGPAPRLAPACPRTPRAPSRPRPQRPRAALSDGSSLRPAPGAARRTPPRPPNSPPARQPAPSSFDRWIRA